jgi:HlyD family secretion protein
MELRAQLERGRSPAHLRRRRCGSHPGGSTQVSAAVWQVSPIIDPNTRQGIARIALNYNPALRPGGFAAAQIITGSSEAPQLPQSAIQTDAQGNYVYTSSTRRTSRAHSPSPPAR